MADLAKKIDLTTDWQEVTAGAFVGQKDDKSTLYLTNADDTPISPVVLTEQGTDLLVYPAVAVGKWYACVAEGTGTLKFVEV